MGEALIVRRGGGGGDISLEYVETIYKNKTSSSLDANSTYFLSVSAAEPFSENAMVGSGVYLLKDGVISTLYQDPYFSRSPVTYNASTSTVSLDSIGNDYVQSNWDELELTICKVS